MKKTYIQPEVKEIKINLPVVLQAISGNNGYKLDEEENVDSGDPIYNDGSDAI